MVGSWWDPLWDPSDRSGISMTCDGPHVTRDTHVGLVVRGCPRGWLGSWVCCLALGLACPSTATAAMIDEPRLQPAQVLVPDSQRPAGGDAGVFCPARWRWRPRRETRAPAPVPAPNYAARSRPPGNLTAQWAARSLAALVSTPPDRDDGAPGWGRLCSASSGVDH